MLDERVRLREVCERAKLENEHAPLITFLELATGLQQSYMLANPGEKRGILKSTTSNLTLDGKNLEIALRSPFQEVANLHSLRSSTPNRGTPRTFSRYLREVFHALTAHLKVGPNSCPVGTPDRDCDAASSASGGMS